jgi:hypothetical protein
MIKKQNLTIISIEGPHNYGNPDVYDRAYDIFVQFQNSASDDECKMHVIMPISTYGDNLTMAEFAAKFYESFERGIDGLCYAKTIYSKNGPIISIYR